MLGYALLLGAWSMATAPFGSPDEVGHYVRASGVGRGDLVGTAVTAARLPVSTDVTRVQRAWLAQNTRGSVVPVTRVPADVSCLPGTRRGADCTVATWVGSYPPLGYLAPGLAGRAASSADSADRLGRLASALLVLLLLGWATFLAWRRGKAIALAAQVGAVTPMVLFVGAMLNPSGLEIAAAILFATATVSVADPGASRPAWAALAVGGALLAVTRSLGPLFIAADLAVLGALLGRRGALVLLRRHAGGAAASLGLLVAATAAGRVWEHGHGATPELGLSPWTTSLADGFADLPDVMHQAVGSFGTMTAPLPVPAVLVWLAIVAVPVTAALCAGGRRERLVLLALIAANAAFPAVLYAAAVRHTGWDVQGRYILPLLVSVPIVAGEICRRHDAALLRRHAAPLVAIAGVVHLVGWMGAMAQGDALPPLSWGPWTLCAAAAALAFLAAARGLRQITEPRELAAREPVLA